MKIKKNRKPRTFFVGKKKNIKIKHLADIFLNNNELLTFKDNKSEYDFSKKNWGYYSTPSINSRLKKFDYKVCLVKNTSDKRYFIFTVKNTKKKEFKKYLSTEKLKVVFWFTNNILKKLDELYL
tara:strand:- start:4669 stop:5040 length:372 start_codon:yes stop_codon:yes gene_type:complete